MVLVGNKCDLEHEREVSKEEAENLAQKFSCPFMETSAKNRINVDESFKFLVREVRKVNPATPTNGKKQSDSSTTKSKNGKKGFLKMKGCDFL